MQNALVWIDGRTCRGDEAVVSVYDHGLLYGDGIFEGIRVYNRRILKLGTHLRRLYESAASIHLRIPYEPESLADFVRTLVKKSDRVDGYIRLVVTRGTGPLGVNPLQCPKARVIIIVDDIAVYPAEAYEMGLSVISASTLQKHPGSLDPRIKSLNYLPNMLARLEAHYAGAQEAVLYNHLGFVTECVGDNIFTVRNSMEAVSLYSPHSRVGLLEGVTMQIVVELATRLGFPVERRDMTRHDLYTADEIFLTGTGAEVVPVVKIDGRKVGDGSPGPTTLAISAAFRRYVANAPED